ncbi:MAG TPA: nucleotidyltransferase domain-containing protein [Ktedonobacterales bacterium]
MPWLDQRTAALVRAIIVTVAQRHTNLRAAIAFGSAARHEKRALTDPEPSDVDLLLLFDTQPGETRLSYAESLAIFHSVGLARNHYLFTPREVEVLLAVNDLSDWDPSFVENVARDGVLLWARRQLPDVLAPVATRALPWVS